jgi:DNA-binding ferritin-like protein (Dps family)
MKTILQYILAIMLLFTGCATTAVQHTIYQQQIEQKQDKLTDDAKGLLVKATEMLRVNSGSIDIKRVQMLLEKSQSLLGVNIDDGKELKNLNGEELDKAVDKVVTEDEKEKYSIDDLKKKDAQEVGKLVASNIEYEVLKKDQAVRNRKFYTTCAVILALIAAAMYFIPSGASKGLLSIFKK